jgi:hypothetical protein
MALRRRSTDERSYQMLTNGRADSLYKCPAKDPTGAFDPASTASSIPS